MVTRGRSSRAYLLEFTQRAIEVLQDDTIVGDAKDSIVDALAEELCIPSSTDPKERILLVRGRLGQSALLLGELIAAEPGEDNLNDDTAAETDIG